MLMSMCSDSSSGSRRVIGSSATAAAPVHRERRAERHPLRVKAAGAERDVDCAIVCSRVAPRGSPVGILGRWRFFMSSGSDSNASAMVNSSIE